MNLNLNQKTALVCGSTQGIGRACAVELAKEGVQVTLMARNEEKLKAGVKTLPNQELNHEYLVADFSNPNNVKEVIMSSKKTFHILVNNTGGPAGGPIFSAKIEEFTNAFSQHLQCNHILTQAIVPYMKEVGYGRIVNIISTSVKEPLDGLGVSNTIRGAVGNWSKTLANELGEFGITVNNVLPGATATGRIDQIINAKSEKSGIPPAQIKTAMENASPAKRFAQPEETAYAVVFLASEAASFINGINVPVDGGRTKSL